MDKLVRAINIARGLITGSAVVILKQDDARAKVYCGKNIDREFMVRSMASTLKSIKMPRMAS